MPPGLANGMPNRGEAERPRASAAAALRAACAEGLPSVASTLSGLITATEVVAQKVLDEADRLAAARDELCRAVVALRPFITLSQPGAVEACQGMADAATAISARIEPIVTSMEFQDLTAQHLRAGIEVVETIRGQLTEFLNLMNVVTDDAETEGPSHVAAKLGAPAVKSPWRQALADELINERGRGQ